MTDLTGQTLSEYQLIELLDQAGTAFVYKGYQPQMDRYVAVKVLSPSLVQDPAAIQQFKGATELQARMEHRRILPIYDSGEQENNHYRVSRYVESGTLRDNLSWFYDPRAAHGLISSIVEGLNYIHQQGLIHGNLKPGNIYLDEQRQALLADFGFAKRIGAAPNVYLSPEQVQGGPVDRRTDVYSLGVLLYEMLTGSPPPAGTVASPRAQRPDLPPDVEQVIFKAMAQNPDHRYQTAGEFASALQASLMTKVPPSPQPIPQTQATPSPPAPASKPKRDTSWLVFLMGGLFIVVLVACGVLFYTTFLDDGAQATPEGPGIEEPTEPPVATDAPPTEELPPTDVPPPTEEIPPTEGVPPTESPEISEEPPAIENPIEPPPDSGGGIGQICGSIGIGAGAMVLGLGMSLRKRKKTVRG